MRSTFTAIGSSPTSKRNPNRSTCWLPCALRQTGSYSCISRKTQPTTWCSMALRSAPGSLASCSLAPRKLWQTRKPSAMAMVVIQMSMP